jgi:hypothetical protein
MRHRIYRISRFQCVIQGGLPGAIPQAHLRSKPEQESRCFLVAVPGCCHEWGGAILLGPGVHVGSLHNQRLHGIRVVPPERDEENVSRNLIQP